MIKYSTYSTDKISLVSYVLWHINSKSFDAKSCQCIYIKYISCYQIFCIEAFKQARNHLLKHIEMVLMIAI